MEVLDAMAAHALGAVRLAEGDARAALEPLRRSFETWQKLGAPYLAARVRVLVARACRALGDSDGCHLEIDGARAVFQRARRRDGPRGDRRRGRASRRRPARTA